jgi:hypothetical protein
VNMMAEGARGLDAALSKPRETGSMWARAWSAFQRFARRVGDFQARLLLSLFYVLVVGPHALFMKLFADPLGLRTTQSRGWTERSRPEPRTLDEIRRQS